SSESARRDLLDIHPDARATVKVWSFCSEIADPLPPPRDPSEALGLPPFYLYVANQFWQHKDHLTLFRALVLLRERGIAPVVVCSGVEDDPRAPGYMETVRAFIRDNDLTAQVRLLGLLDRRDQLDVLRHCAGMVQPSRFEGWSTVVEDARAVGRPLLLSDIEVHREQAPGGG
ncbi:MAG: glycosyltransferase, partial [Actinomycetota bacterium]|nr:glycosyltransferase [Actinomycetota bacterium]